MFSIVVTFLRVIQRLFVTMPMVNRQKNPDSPRAINHCISKSALSCFSATKNASTLIVNAARKKPISCRVSPVILVVAEAKED